MSLNTIQSAYNQQEDIDPDSDLGDPNQGWVNTDLQDPEDQEEEEFDSFEEEDPDEAAQASPTAVLMKLLPLGLSVLTLLYLFHLGGQVASIRKGHNQVLVQTVNGRSIAAEPVDNYVRTAATVHETVYQWVLLTYNWAQTRPNGEKDEGRQIGTKVFPTSFFYASTLMSRDIQSPWYQVFQQRDDYLPSKFLGSGATRVYYPKMQTTPKHPIDPRTGKAIKDRYEVEYWGEWVEYSPEEPQGKLIDKPAYRLRLRPVVKTQPPLAKTADPLQAAAYELRANGLEIYHIERIKKNGR